MNFSRWSTLMEDADESLTSEELIEGWHFCPDWDGLLVSPGMTEFENCTCHLQYLQVTTVDVHNLTLFREAFENPKGYPF